MLAFEDDEVLKAAADGSREETFRDLFRLLLWLRREGVVVDARPDGELVDTGNGEMSARGELELIAS